MAALLRLCGPALGWPVAFTLLLWLQPSHTAETWLSQPLALTHLCCNSHTCAAEKDLGEFADSFTAAVGVHDVAVLRITPLEGPPDDSWRPWHGQPAYAAMPESLVWQQKEAWVGRKAPWRDVPRGGANTPPIYQSSSSQKDGGGDVKPHRKLASAASV